MPEPPAPNKPAPKLTAHQRAKQRLQREIDADIRRHYAALAERKAEREREQALAKSQPVSPIPRSKQLEQKAAAKREANTQSARKYRDNRRVKLKALAEGTITQAALDTLPERDVQSVLLGQIVNDHADMLTQRLFRVCLRNGMHNPDFTRLTPMRMASVVQELERRSRIQQRFEQAITEQWAGLTLLVPFDHDNHAKPDTRNAWRRVKRRVIKDVNGLLPVQMPDRTRRRLVRVLRDYL